MLLNIARNLSTHFRPQQNSHELPPVFAISRDDVSNEIALLHLIAFNKTGNAQASIPV
jgi:hypothetical protein